MDTNENIKENKKIKNLPKIIVLFAILVLLAALGAFAYARYVTSRNGTVQADVAQFRFEFKNINGQSSSGSGTVQFPITRTDNNQKVDSNCIAPDTYGRFDMIIDTKGTQTSYRYDINVTVTNCPTNLIFYTDKDHQYPITASRSGTGTAQDPKTATFTISKYVPLNRANEEHKEIVYWEWLYETGNNANAIYENDLLDSADMYKTVTMAIVAKVSQVTSQPAGVLAVGEKWQDISIMKLDVSQTDSTSATMDAGQNAEVILTYGQDPKPGNLEDLFISSGDSSIATASVDTVNDKIIVNALKKGTTVITIRGEKSWNITKTITVTVQETYVNELVLSSDNSTVSVAPSGTESVTISNFANLHPVEPFTLTSSDSSVATASYNNGTITITGVAVGSATITLTGTNSGTTKTIAVTVEEPMPELGDYVDLGTNYISETTYDDGTTIEEDWRVFYVEPDTDYVWLIMSDYLPNSTGKAAAAGLTPATGDYATYGVKSSSRTALINGLDYLKTTSYMTDNNASYTGNWKTALFSGNSKLSGNNVTVAGAVDLETWIASWNSKASDAEQLDYNYYTAAVSGEAYAQGYKVKKGTGDFAYYVSGLTRTDKTLYFPRTGTKENCYGYWLASPSAVSSSNVMLVYFIGNVGNNSCSNSSYGVRPAVRLPSNILEKNGNKWELK